MDTLLLASVLALARTNGLVLRAAVSQSKANTALVLLVSQEALVNQEPLTQKGREGADLNSR